MKRKPRRGLFVAGCKKPKPEIVPDAGLQRMIAVSLSGVSWFAVRFVSEFLNSSERLGENVILDPPRIPSADQDARPSNQRDGSGFNYSYVSSLENRHHDKVARLSGHTCNRNERTP